MKYYLAIDIGASGGRHILGHIEHGRMVLEEIYRFENGMKESRTEDGRKQLVWDTEALFGEILKGMKKCGELGRIPVSVGIDTWAVDFALLDSDGKLIGTAVGYRDGRTTGMDAEVYRLIPEKDLYARTGIQKQIFNTVYQLMALKKQATEQLERADAMLMIPDYFNYRLSGVKVQEYTNATTTQLLSPLTGDWDWELIDKLGYPRKIFCRIEQPGYRLGGLLPGIREYVGYDCQVMLPATHDTGSAVAAVPEADGPALYISSGTWSLMGTELKKADCSPEAAAMNFTNEGGYGHTFRYLKNIMGLWMIQSVRKELAPELGYGQICEGAAGCSLTSLVDANDGRFLAPDSMAEAVRQACRESGQQVPETVYELAQVIYRSLAACYAGTVKEIEERTGLRFECIHVVGGGANADYLNRLTADACGRRVCTGPVEATASGNLAVQMIAGGELEDIRAARKCIADSFPMKIYEPAGN